MLEYGTDGYADKYKSLIESRKKSETKPFVFMSPEWCDQYEQSVQSDDRYKQVARNWEGSVVLVVQADINVGLDHDVFLFMDLWHGECTYLSLVPEGKGRSGEFVLEAEYARWEQILKGELNVVKELATRKLKLSPFDFKKAVKLAAASQAAIRLVEIGSSIDTVYPGDMDDNAKKAFASLYVDLHDQFGI